MEDGKEKDFGIAREADLASSLKDKLFFFSSLRTYGGLDSDNSFNDVAPAAHYCECY